MSNPEMEGYEWGERGPKELPEWMEPYRDLIGDTGGNPVEWLLSLSGKDTKGDIILGALCACVSAQIGLLARLHKGGFLC